MLLIVVEHGLRRRQINSVTILYAANFTEKVLQIVTLSKTRKLRDIFQANIDKRPYLRFAQQPEEQFGRLLRKANGIDLQSSSAPSTRNSSLTYAIRCSCRLRAISRRLTGSLNRSSSARSNLAMRRRIAKV